jgi:hypothetical protein
MGAKKRNANALKHGLYARHYSDEEVRSLKEMPLLDSAQEIQMLRASLDKILSMIEGAQDEERKLKLFNSLFLGAQRLANAMRTQTLIMGDNREVLTSFWEALEAFRKEKGL